MLAKIAVVLIVLIVGLLGFAATRPDTFHVQRSTSINASPEKLFPYFDDFHRGSEWSPYEKKDPAMKKTYSGAATGKGAIFEFAGNGDVGAGRLEIIESIPNSKVTVRLNMMKPFEANNIVEYALKAKGETTQVTWAISGPMPFISKVMCIFFDMDKMIGKDFDAGLSALKDLVTRN